MTKAKKYSYLIILLSFIFFWIYSYSNLAIWLPQWLETRHLIFNWPDANAYYFFSQLFGQSNLLFSFESLNLLTDNLLHTRSINVLANGSLVPMTFMPGIIIFGLFFKLLGSAGILFLTPALASLAVFAIYKLIYLISKDLNLSFLVALLFLPLAPWLFFANVVMLPGILFICLLSLGFLALFYGLKKSQTLFIAGSFLIAWAIIIRPTELIWILVILAMLWWWNKDKISKRTLYLSIIMAALIIFIGLLLNKLVYGGWLTFGYFNLAQETLPTEFSNQQNSFVSWLKLLFLPFGWQNKIFLANTWHYLIKLMWPYWLLALLALIFLKDKLAIKNNWWRRYFFLNIIVFIIILVYYANWNIADPLVKQYNQISISYVRYFLPLYILLLPFVALSIRYLSKFKNKNLKIFIQIFFVIILAIFSFKLTFLSPNDGLFKNKANITEYYQQFNAVKEIAPQHAIIITERSDKVFFPYYKVIVPQGDLPLWSRLVKIMDSQEIFYFTAKTDEQIAAENQIANESDLEIVLVKKIDDQFRLMKIQIINQ